jgi:protein involved in temperature-dependent protein secretion
MEALEAAPDSAWLRFKLGKLFCMMGDYGGAARQVQVLSSTNQALADQLSLKLAAMSTVPGL